MEISVPLSKTTRDSVEFSSPAIPISFAEVEANQNLSPFEREEIKSYLPEVYYCAPRVSKAHHPVFSASVQGFDDPNGRYRLFENDHIKYRYEILHELGKGTFGNVVKAYDHKRHQTVAIKIIRNKAEMKSQAVNEATTLIRLSRVMEKIGGPPFVVKLLDKFMFREHFCLVFEELEESLYDALKRTRFMGFQEKSIAPVILQVLRCLEVMTKMKLIHTDLKPENIMVANPQQGGGVRVIDFGSSYSAEQLLVGQVQSRYYRAPEVTLECGFGLPVDMWSLGCIVAELFTGEPLFPGKSEKDLLRYQMEVLGAPPARLLKHGTTTGKYFGGLHPSYTFEHEGTVRDTRTFERRLDHVLRETSEELRDFVSQCLQWNPEDRMTPSEAFNHPFISKHCKPRKDSAMDSIPKETVKPTAEVSDGAQSTWL